MKRLKTTPEDTTNRKWPILLNSSVVTRNWVGVTLITSTLLILLAFALGSPGSRALRAEDNEGNIASATNLMQQAMQVQHQRAEIRNSLAKLLRSKNEQVQLTALKGLRELGPDRDTAYAIWLFLYNPHAEEVLLEALTALAESGQFLSSDLDRVRRLLKDERPKVRRAAAYALGEVGAKDWRSVAALIAALKDKDHPKDKNEVNVRHFAAQALGKFGRHATAAVPALLELSKDPDSGAAGEALRAVGQIGPEDPRVMPALIEILKSRKDPAWTAWAAVALGCIGPEAKAAVPALIDALDVKWVKEPEKAIALQVAAAGVLENIGPAAKAAVPALIVLVKNKELDPQVRQFAALALGGIGATAKDTLPALRAAEAENADPRINDAARDAIKKIEE